MKKSGSNTSIETPEQELKRLRKENSMLKGKLKTQKEADKAKIKSLKKELKKKDVPTITISTEQRMLLSNRFPDIDSVFNW